MQEPTEISTAKEKPHAPEREDWPRERCLKLIELYEQHPSLWDQTHPNYTMNRYMLRARAWREISLELNSTVVEVRHKMDTLLASFRREKKLVMKKAQQELNTNCTSNWYAFKAFKFLLFQQTKNKAKPATVQQSTPKMFTKCPPTPNVIVMKPPSTERVKQKENEISSFTDFVASKMRKYSNATNNAVQKEICEILFKADQNFYDKDTCDSTSPICSHSIPSTSRVQDTSREQDTSRVQDSPEKNDDSDYEFDVKEEIITIEEHDIS